MGDFFFWLRVLLKGCVYGMAPGVGAVGLMGIKL